MTPGPAPAARSPPAAPAEGLAQAWREYYVREQPRAAAATGRRGTTCCATASRPCCGWCRPTPRCWRSAAARATCWRRCPTRPHRRRHVARGDRDRPAALPGHHLPGGEAPALEGLPRFDAIICDRLGHSVLDVRALLLSLRERLTPGGRIFLTTFNYLWEVPSRLAERLGWKLPAPTSNWFSETDFRNLFDDHRARGGQTRRPAAAAPRRAGGGARPQPLPGQAAGRPAAVALPHLRPAPARSARALGAPHRDGQRGGARAQRGGQHRRRRRADARAWAPGRRSCSSRGARPTAPGRASRR